jgi:hypothetical protein
VDDPTMTARVFAEGIEDIHFHPAVPRTARGCLIVSF